MTKRDSGTKIFKLHNLIADYSAQDLVRGRLLRSEAYCG